MAQQPPTPSGKVHAKSYPRGICETQLRSTEAAAPESSALPREAPGPTKFPMRAVLLLGQRGCDMCYLSNRDKCVLQLQPSLCSRRASLVFLQKMLRGSPQRGPQCLWLSASWHAGHRHRYELRLTQTCLPCYPLLQLVSSGLQRTSSESVWQEQDQQLCASPLHRFSSQMAPTAQGFLLNLNARGCLSAL